MSRTVITHPDGSQTTIRQTGCCSGFVTVMLLVWLAALLIASPVLILPTVAVAVLAAVLLARSKR